MAQKFEIFAGTSLCIGFLVVMYVIIYVFH